MKKQGNIEAFGSDQKYTNLAESFLNSDIIKQNEVNYFHLGVKKEDLSKIYDKNSVPKEELENIPKFYKTLDGTIKDYNNGQELKDGFEKINKLLTTMQQEHGEKSFTTDTRIEIENIFRNQWPTVTRSFDSDDKKTRLNNAKDNIVKEQNKEISTSLVELKNNTQLPEGSKEKIDNLLKQNDPVKFQTEVVEFTNQLGDISDKNLDQVKSLCNEGTKIRLENFGGEANDYAKILDTVNKAVETFENLSKKLTTAPTLLYSTTLVMQGQEPTKDEKHRAIANLLIEQRNITGLDPKQENFQEALDKLNIKGKIEVIFEKSNGVSDGKPKPPTIINYKINPKDFLKVLKKTDFNTIPSGNVKTLATNELFKAREDVKDLIENKFANKTKLRKRAKTNQFNPEVKLKDSKVSITPIKQEKPNLEQPNPSIIFPENARETLTKLINELKIKSPELETIPIKTEPITKPIEEKNFTGTNEELEKILSTIGPKETIIESHKIDTIQPKRTTQTLEDNIKELGKIDTSFLDDFTHAIDQAIKDPSTQNKSVIITTEQKQEEKSPTELAQTELQNKSINEQSQILNQAVISNKNEDVVIALENEIKTLNPSITSEEINETKNTPYSKTEEDFQKTVRIKNEITQEKELDKKLEGPEQKEKNEEPKIKSTEERQENTVKEALGNLQTKNEQGRYASSMMIDAPELKTIIEKQLLDQTNVKWSQEEVNKIKESPETQAIEYNKLIKEEKTKDIEVTTPDVPEKPKEIGNLDKINKKLGTDVKSIDELKKIDKINQKLGTSFDSIPKKEDLSLENKDLPKQKSKLDKINQKLGTDFTKLPDNQGISKEEKPLAKDIISFDNNSEENEFPSHNEDLESPTERIRGEIVIKQQQLLQEAIISNTKDEELKTTLTNLEGEALLFFLRSEQGKKEALEALKDKDVQKKLNDIEVAGYQEIHSKFKENYKDVTWAKTDEQTRSTQVKNAAGELVADIKETTVKNPTTLILDDGTTKTIESYRTIDFPKELETGKGPLHMSMAVKDEKGNNISEKDAVYFTAHYDDSGKLTEVTSPIPVKFMGKGDDAVGYIERDGKIFTLPVTQAKYKEMMKEVALNKGMGIDLSQDTSIEKETEDKVITSDKKEPKKKIEEVKETQVQPEPIKVPIVKDTNPTKLVESEKIEKTDKAPPKEISAEPKKHIKNPELAKKDNELSEEIIQKKNMETQQQQNANNQKPIGKSSPLLKQVQKKKLQADYKEGKRPTELDKGIMNANPIKMIEEKQQEKAGLETKTEEPKVDLNKFKPSGNKEQDLAQIDKALSGKNPKEVVKTLKEQAWKGNVEVVGLIVEATKSGRTDRPKDTPELKREQFLEVYKERMSSASINKDKMPKIHEACGKLKEASGVTTQYHVNEINKNVEKSKVVNRSR